LFVPSESKSANFPTKPMHISPPSSVSRISDSRLCFNSTASTFVPAQFRVLVTRRPKYACRSCECGIKQASARPRLIEGGLPTEATVASVIVAKFANHLPLYRQAQIYARQGVDLDWSTLAA
jgi:hypothetical protein